MDLRPIEARWATDQPPRRRHGGQHSRLRQRARGRSALSALVVLACVASACSSDRAPTTGATSPPSSSVTTPSAATSPNQTTITVDDIAAAGIEVVADDASPSGQAALAVGTVQADRMLASVGEGDGILGRDLDALADMGAGAPPMSYLVAGWATTATTPGAATARDILGEQNWTHSPELHFPTLVLTLFVGDIAGEVDALAPEAEGFTPAPAPTGLTQLGAPVAGHRALAGPCSVVTGFISSVLSGLFNALRIKPSSGGGILGAIGNILTSAWNAALGFAQGLIEGLIATITAPVFEAIRLAVGALGVATLVQSYFTDQTLDTRPEPATRTRFAIGDEADVEGTFVARTKELTGNWPAALLDCAAVAGAALPKLIEPGAATTWTLDDGGVVRTTTLESTVDADLSTRLPFTTGRETVEQAKGAVVIGVAYAQVRIPRKEIDDFLRFARTQLNDVQTSLVQQLPGPAQGAAQAVLAQVVGPSLDRLQSDISGAAGGWFALTGSTAVYVEHHEPPEEPEASAGTSTTEPGDFCTEWAKVVGFWEQQTSTDFSVVFGAVLPRLEDLRDIVPDDLTSDLEVIISVGRQLRDSGSDPVVVLDIMKSSGEAMAAAAQHLFDVCGVTIPG